MNSNSPTADSVPALDRPTAQLVDCCNLLALDLYGQLAGGEKGDLFYSPTSLSLALAMTMAGAVGETASEMADTLRLTTHGERVHERFRRLQASTRTGSTELYLANRLWGQRGLGFRPSFRHTTERCYGAGLEEVDFESDPEAARQRINAWICEKTRDKIPELLPRDLLTPLDRLVLTNAIYFAGCWESKFRESDTEVARFWLNSDDSVRTPMMRQSATFRFGEFPDLQVLILPYRAATIEWQAAEQGGEQSRLPVEVPGGGSDFEMCLLVPREPDGLADLEDRLSPANLAQWLSLRAGPVDVSLPRFRVESQFRMENCLQQLGMRRAFSPTEADFSEMSDDPEGLFIGAVIHKAFVDVYEEGTEAAAATAVRMLATGAMKPRPPYRININRPFLFLIRDRATRLIHFLGRVTHPQVD